MVKSQEIIRRVWNERTVRILFSILLLMLAVVFVLALLKIPSQAQAPGQVIEFNGHTLSLDGAAQVKVQSSNSVTSYDDVTVTVNTVTVTVWMQAPAE